MKGIAAIVVLALIACASAGILNPYAGYNGYYSAPVVSSTRVVAPYVSSRVVSPYVSSYASPYTYGSSYVSPYVSPYVSASYVRSPYVAPVAYSRSYISPYSSYSPYSVVLKK